MVDKQYKKLPTLLGHFSQYCSSQATMYNLVEKLLREHVAPEIVVDAA